MAGNAPTNANAYFCCGNVLENEFITKRVYDYKNLFKKYSNIKSVTFDAMLAAYLCNPSASDYSVLRLIAEYGTEVQIENCNDEVLISAAQFTMCCNSLTKALEQSGQLELLLSIELPLARVLGSMELVGFLADFDGLAEHSKVLQQRIDALTGEIYSLAGEEFNINSPKQLGQILFVKLELPAKKKTKSGFSTNAEVLEELRYDFPIVELILQYRQLAKLKSTYCDGLLACRGVDGRIHSTLTRPKHVQVESVHLNPIFKIFPCVPKKVEYYVNSLLHVKATCFAMPTIHK